MEHTSPLHLFQPQWQGSGPDDAIFHGARLLREEIESQSTIRFYEAFNGIDPAAVGHGTDFEGIQFGEVLSANYRQVRDLLLRRPPSRVFSLGGDCSIDLAPVSYLASHRDHAQTFGLVWLDAHADLNSPQTFPSKHFHGMVLRRLLSGCGVTEADSFPPLHPRQVLLAGVRDLDPAEERFIEENRVTVISSEELRATGAASILKVLRERGLTSCYVHIDSDTLDPQTFPHVKVPTPEGLSVTELFSVVEGLREDRNIEVVGGSLVEIVGTIDESPIGKGSMGRLYSLLST